MKLVTAGSQWWAGGGTRFVVSKIVEEGKNTWVHYYNDNNHDQKYSCYLEAFLGRFTELPK
jgi:hypothetical protein